MKRYKKYIRHFDGSCVFLRQSRNVMYSNWQLLNRLVLKDEAKELAWFSSHDYNSSYLFICYSSKKLVWGSLLYSFWSSKIYFILYSFIPPYEINFCRYHLNNPESTSRTLSKFAVT